jgi:hypothetical protein
MPDSNIDLPEGIQQSRRNRDGPYFLLYLNRQWICMVIRIIIHNIRGQKVMLDHDLASLYGVETKILNQAVKRNIERFPADFMIQLTDIEALNLKRSQFVTAVRPNVNPRFQPYAFTELGIAMLSSVLRSQQAIQVNISIMRTLFRLRDLLQAEKDYDAKIDALTKGTSDLFKIVFKRIDDVEEIITPLDSSKRRKIGI